MPTASAGGVYTVHVQHSGRRFATGGADALVKQIIAANLGTAPARAAALQPLQAASAAPAKAAAPAASGSR